VFGNYTQTYKIDIEGYSAKVTKATLNETRSMSSTLTLSLTLWVSDSSKYAIRCGVYDGENRLVDYFEQELSLTQGSNTIELQEVIETEVFGTHTCVYNIYVLKNGFPDLLLTSGSELIDLKGPTLISLYTTKTNYAFNESITGSVRVAYAKDNLLRIYLDSVEATNVTISDDTIQNIPFSIVPTHPGIHKITARIGKANRTVDIYVLPEITPLPEIMMPQLYTTKVVEDVLTGVKVKFSYRGFGNISITKVSPPGAIPANLQDINLFVEITAPTTMQIDWAYIEIPYNETNLPGEINETQLKMYYWTGNAYEKCPEADVDINNNIVWANVTHLTIFAPMAEKVKEEVSAPLSWFVYAGIIAVVVIIAVSLAVIRKKKRIFLEK
jgi:hypothetical protein